MKIDIQMFNVYCLMFKDLKIMKNEVNRAFMAKKTANTIKNFAKRVVMVLSAILMVGNAWGGQYTYNFADATNWYTTSAKTTNVSTGNTNNYDTFYDTNGVAWTASGASRYFSGTYFLLGKTSAYVVLPTYSGEKITSVVLHGSTGHSTSVSVNIYTTGGTAASSAQTWSTRNVDHTYNIGSDYQASTLRIQVTNNYNTQFTSVTINTESTGGGGSCNAIDVTGGSAVTLPAGSTTVSSNDWKNAGAPTAYNTAAEYSIGSGTKYCVTLTQAMDGGSSNGLQLKASAGIISITGITSTSGVDVDVQISSGSGISIALTGASTLTGQSSGTKTISTTSTSADLTISKTSSGAGYIKYIKITPKAAAGCSAPTAPTNGSISSTGWTAGWTAPASAPGSGYVIVYKNANSAPGDAITESSHTGYQAETSATTSKAITLSGVSAGETCYWWVRSKCGTGNYSSWLAGTAFVVPQITAGSASGTSTYVAGSGPGSVQTFTVSGVGLTGNLTVTAPSNFQVSTDNGSTWSTSGGSKTITASGTLSSTTVKFRLASDLAQGSYGPSNVVVSGGGAASVNVSVSGTVTAAVSKTYHEWNGSNAFTTSSGGATLKTVPSLCDWAIEPYGWCSEENYASSTYPTDKIWFKDASWPAGKTDLYALYRVGSSPYYYSTKPTIYTITYNLTNVTKDDEYSYTCMSDMEDAIGTSNFAAYFKPATGYTLDESCITITMGGAAVSSSNYYWDYEYSWPDYDYTAELYMENITGNVVVTVTGKTCTVLGDATGLTVQNPDPSDASKVRFSWTLGSNTSAHATKQVFTLSKVGGSSASGDLSASATTCTQNIASLSNGTYNWSVQAIGDGSSYCNSADVPGGSFVICKTDISGSSVTVNAATSITTTGATANWTAVANADHYTVKVYEGSNASGTLRKTYTDVTGTSQAITGLTAGAATTYYIEVQAHDACEHNSNKGGVTFTTLAAHYTITYNKGAYGTGSTIANGDKTHGVNFTLSSSTFTRDGYRQDGWSTSDGGSKTYELGGTYTGNANLNLYPHWNLITYSNYRTNCVAAKTLDHITITTAPTAVNYLTGQTFSSAGAVVEAYYTDDTHTTVSASVTWTAPATPLAAGTGQTVVASYTEGGVTKTANQTINVYGVTIAAEDVDGVNLIAASKVTTPTVTTITTFTAAANGNKYTFKEWQITNGKFTGNVSSTTSNPATIESVSGAVTVTAVYYKPITVTWHVPSGVWSSDDYTRPWTVQHPANPNPATYGCTDKVFYGWTKTADYDDDDPPTDLVANGEELDSNTDLYAVFAVRTGEGTTDQWTKTAVSAITAGTYLICGNTGGYAGKVFNGSTSSGHGWITDEAFSDFSSSVIEENAPVGACELTLTTNSSGFSMYNSTYGYLYCTKASSGGLSWNASEQDYWWYTGSSWRYHGQQSSGSYVALSDYGSSFRTYTSDITNPVFLKKTRTGSPATYSDFSTNCACDAYSFHYGPHTGDWELPICFTQVDATHEWNIENFTIPSHTNGEFYVGYQNATNGQSVTKAWTDDYSESASVGNGAMLLLPTSSSKVGQAIGATGTLVIWDNTSSKNQYVGFRPDGYAINYSSSNKVFTETATPNKWETEVQAALPNVSSTTYTMGIKTASGYTTCAHSSAAENINAMGVTIVENGKKKIYLTPGSFNTAGAVYAVWDATNSAWGDGTNKLMTDADGDGVWEGYVASNCTTIILVRLSSGTTASNIDWSRKWNQTANITINDLANRYQITSLNGDNCSYTTTALHPATGQIGKFRMWANSNNQNWYVHFVPYYVLTYDANGGSGAPAATNKNSEETGAVAISSTEPTRSNYRFMGWATTSERAAAGTVDYKYGTANNEITLTGDQTLYAVWAQEFTVTYAANGGTTSCSEPNHIAGETVTVCATEPSKDCSTFTGWLGDNSIGTKAASSTFTMPAANVTLTAQWNTTTYAITYKDQGDVAYSGSNSGSLPDTHTCGSATALVNGERAGYRFDGWFTTSACTGEPISSIAGGEVGPFTLYAKWTASHTFTFKDYENTTVATIGQVEGGNVVMPTTTADCGLWTTFEGWVIGTVAETTTEPATIYKPGDIYVAGSGDQEFKALYSKHEGDATVSYVKETSGPKSGTYILVSEMVSSKYYTTTGWDSGNSKYATTEVTMSDNGTVSGTNATSAGAAEFTIRAGNGTNSGKFAMYDGAKYLESGSSISRGDAQSYTWELLDGNTDVNSKGTPYPSAGSIHSTSSTNYNLEYNASQPRFAMYGNTQKEVFLYRKKVAGTTYYATNPASCSIPTQVVVSYNDNKSHAGDQTISGMPSGTTLTFDPYPNFASYTVGSAPTDPTGYHFAGWNTSADGSGSDYAAGASVTTFGYVENVTLYAKWERVYSVTLYDNGVERTTLTEASGGAGVTLPSGNNCTPSSPFTFVGWTESAVELNADPVRPASATLHAAGSYEPTSDITLYSVYSRSVAGCEDFAAGVSGAYKLTDKGSGQYALASGGNSSSYARGSSGDAEIFYIGYSTAKNAYTIRTSTGYLGWFGASGSETLTKGNATPYYWNITAGTGDNTGYWNFSPVGISNRQFSGNISSKFQIHGNSTKYYIQLTKIAMTYYYNTALCGDATITFHDGGGTISGTPTTPAGSSWNSGTHVLSGLENCDKITTFPTASYDGWTFVGWSTEDYSNSGKHTADYSEENGSTDEPDASIIYKTDGNPYVVRGGSIDLYPVFTRFPDNEPINLTDGGNYYIYYLAPNSDDGYGGNVRIYAGAYEDHGATNSNYPGTHTCSEATLFTFEKSGDYWTIKDNSTNKYLGGTSSDDGIPHSNDPSNWTITISGSQFDASCTSSNTRQLIAYDYSSDAARAQFMNYASVRLTQTPSANHRVYLGSCTERIFSSEPNPVPTIDLIGSPMVTSSAGERVRATATMTLSGSHLASVPANKVKVSGTNLKFAKDATTNPADYVMVDVDGSGNASATIYVYYTPAVGDTEDGIENIIVTAQAFNSSQAKDVQTTGIVQVRHLPADFVIAAKWDGKWYALPNTCAGEGSNTAGVLISVDDDDDPTVATAAPHIAKWGLRQTKAGSRTDGSYNDRLVFTERTTAEANSQKTLYNYNKAEVFTNATYTNYNNTNPERYEWIPVTTDFGDYELTNANDASHHLILRNSDGTFVAQNTDKAYDGKVRLLPATFYEEAPV